MTFKHLFHNSLQTWTYTPMGISYATVDQQKKVVKPTEPQKEKEERSGGKVTEKGKEIKKNLEDLMDQIDEVLEQNAEEFVKNFTQRGGE